MSIKKYSIISTAFLLLILPVIYNLNPHARANPFPDRYINLNPLAHEIKNGGFSIFPIIGGWGEFGKYSSSASDFEHNYNAKLGVAAEFFRYKNLLTLMVSSDIELVANPRSEINFNPRSFFWQEGFIFIYNFNYFYGQIGYIHRCKHDIDNLEILDEEGERKERVIIYDSILLKFVSRKLNLLGHEFFPLETILFLRGDFFVYTDDDIIWSVEPGLKERSSFNNLKTSFQFGLTTDLIKYEFFALYFKGQYAINIFTYGDSNSNKTFGASSYVFEMGLSIMGGGGRMNLFFNYEYQYDTAINPYRENAHLLLIGLRIYDNRVYY
ncbi:hypothetical protein ACFL20_03035 [Spirochaetota bacterium]